MITSNAAVPTAARRISRLDALCNFMVSFLWLDLAVVIEGEGGLFLGTGFVPGFQQGADAAFRGGDAGHKTDHAENNHHPQTQTEPVLSQVTQVQKQAEGEQNGQTELTHPEDQGQCFHTNSVGIK